MNEEDQLAELGALRAEGSGDHPEEEPLDLEDDHDLDLELHDPLDDPPAPPIARPEQALIDRGQFGVSRSADGLELMNTLEILPPFELSI